MTEDKTTETKIETLQEQSFDKVNAAIAGLILIITLVIYNLTKAPTFSFWDCGEFVACSYILGIPHPPGSPLYILIGRIFSIIPFSSDIGANVNMLSSVASAFAAMFGYLVTVRLIRYWYRKRDEITNRIIIYIGGFTGALFMAFGNTNWTNSVEAEVYAPTILLMVIIFWLALKYMDHRETPRGSRYMLLAVYLSMLGIGIHLTMFLVVPVAALFFILKKESGIREWAAVSLFFMIELYLIYQMSSRPNEVPFYMPVLIFFVIFLFHTFLQGRIIRSMLYGLIIFLIALYPLYFKIVDSLSRALSGSGLSSSVEGLSKLPIGEIGLAGLAIWGIYGLMRHFYAKSKTKGDASHLITGIYCLAPVLLVGINEVLRGYHAFLFLTALLVAIIALLLYKHINWPVLIGIVAFGAVMLGFWQFIYGLIGGVVLIIILAIRTGNRGWRTAAAIVLLAVIGYSVHLFIPIRSAHNPIIDENNPSSSMAAFTGYLERKQYGAESMTERMFQRRAEWANQFGDYRRMGFWRFFKDQYGFKGSRFVVVLLLGLFGIWETIRRRPTIGLPFLVLLLICSVGLILYMNFADGTRQHPVTGLGYLEVRDRDYFFTPAFVFFGLAIGLGIAGFIDLVRDSFGSSGSGRAAFGISCCAVLLPLFPLLNNYFVNDRSRNYMPYDYAYNQLTSCRENAILITNADNDTFPAWCIQEVYGFRKDVKVVNLSLANTPWYIKQLRDNYKVPISWTDEQIEALRPYRDQTGQGHRVQDQVVDHILTVNDWRLPVNVSVTIPPGKLKYDGQSMQERMTLEGMVYRLAPEEKAPNLNYELTDSMYSEAFVYRGVADSTVYKNETSQRLTGNYAQGFLFMADARRKAKDYEGALKHIHQGLEILPRSTDIYSFAAQVLGEMGRLDTMEAFIASAPESGRHGLYYNWGLAAKFAGRVEEAINILEMTMEMYPDYVEAFRSLVRIYYENKYYSRLRVLVEKWVSRHPEDTQSAELLRQIRMVDRTQDTLEGR